MSEKEKVDLWLLLWVGVVKPKSLLQAKREFT